MVASLRKRPALRVAPETKEDKSEDENCVPPSEQKSGHKKKRRKMKWVKRTLVPDMTELSLPKPASRLDPILDLSGSAVLGASQMPHLLLGALGPVALPVGSPKDAVAHTSQGFLPISPRPNDLRVSQYRKFYSKQLPSMPFYGEAYHTTLSFG